MDTPICNFVRRYAESGALRMHMPGHKGRGPLGLEQLDITEIDGADSLYEAAGIIRRSEENASRLFGCETFYSTEGSSQCIRAMLYLVAMRAGRKPLIAAVRNVHKTFLSAAALLDFEVLWLRPGKGASYLSCKPEPRELEELFRGGTRPDALYLTSPDYLGNLADIAAISEVCRRWGVLLVVDNAHGAYLRFLRPSLHPMDLGADLCCDSAHKTLPVLTGGAYLHISRGLSGELAPQAKSALAMFGSTSPSYLILQSLDAANACLDRDYPRQLEEFSARVLAMKERLKALGYSFLGDEPLKLTLDAKAYGYEGRELAALLLGENIVCEFSDPDYLVLMLTPETGIRGLDRLEEVLGRIPRREVLHGTPPELPLCRRVMSIREAAFSRRETVPAAQSVGRVLADPSVSCPPAVPVVICGERIDEAALRCFSYYGVEECTVVVPEALGSCL